MANVDWLPIAVGGMLLFWGGCGLVITLVRGYQAGLFRDLWKRPGEPQQGDRQEHSDDAI